MAHLFRSLDELSLQHPWTIHVTDIGEAIYEPVAGSASLNLLCGVPSSQDQLGNLGVIAGLQQLHGHHQGLGCAAVPRYCVREPDVALIRPIELEDAHPIR